MTSGHQAVPESQPKPIEGCKRASPWETIATGFPMHQEHRSSVYCRLDGPSQLIQQVRDQVLLVDQHGNPTELLCSSVWTAGTLLKKNISKPTCSKWYYQAFSTKIRFFLWFSKGIATSPIGSRNVVLLGWYRDSFRKSKEKAYFCRKCLIKPLATSWFRYTFFQKCFICPYRAAQ